MFVAVAWRSSGLVEGMGMPRRELSQSKAQAWVSIWLYQELRVHHKRNGGSWVNAEVLWRFDRSEANSKVPLLEIYAGFGKGSGKFSSCSFLCFLRWKLNIRPSCFFQSFSHSQALSNLSRICQSADRETRLWIVFIGLRCRICKSVSLSDVERSASCL